MERNGTKLESLLVRNNPWASEPCERSTCTVCNQKEVPKQPRCRTRNMTYMNLCMICKKEGKETLYIGETYRSIKERHGEHIRDWLDEKEESHMTRHSKECHNGVTDFMIKPISSHRTAMGRQISETVRIKIKTLEGANLLNSKTEYNRFLLPELTV